jgi:membrane associated rhomboid family serine protease
MDIESSARTIVTESEREKTRDINHDVINDITNTTSPSIGNNNPDDSGIISDVTLTLSPLPPPPPLQPIPISVASTTALAVAVAVLVPNADTVTVVEENEHDDHDAKVNYQEDIDVEDNHGNGNNNIDNNDDDDGNGNVTGNGNGNTDNNHYVVDVDTTDNSNNKEDNEEERVDFFLRCYDDVVTSTSTTTRNNGNHDQNNDDGEYEEKIQLQNFLDESYGSSTGDSYDDNNDDSNNNEYYEYNNNNNSYNNNNVIITTSENTVIEVAPTYLLDNEAVLKSLRSSNDDGQHDDPTVALFFKLFKFAQMERLKKPGSTPYLIQGLFSNLSDVRSDLEWAQDATYRRQSGQPYIAWADYYAKERRGGILKCPIFISCTLFICTVTMIYAFYKNNWKIESLNINPLIGPNPQVLLDMGALQGRALIEDGKWWLLITPIFLHAGIVHLLLNGAILIFLCRSIERNHGWLHTGILFLVSGMFGNMISALLQPGYILVGASGGIYGLLGVCVADIVLNSRFFFLVLEERQQDACALETRKKNRREGRSSNNNANEDGTTADNAYTIQCRRRRVRFWCYFSLVCDLLLNSLVGLLPFVDNFAHLGGLLFGFFVSLSSLRLLSASSFDYRRKQQSTTLGRWCHRLSIISLRCGGGLSALALLFVAMMFLRQSDGTTSPCPNCRYVSCIPLPRPWKPNDEKNWWNCDGCSGVTATAFKGRGNNSRNFVTLEVFCPNGNLIEVDISEEQYTIVDQVNTALPDLCGEFCVY